MFYDDDLDAFFSDFAEDVMINGQNIKAIFSDRYEGVNLDGQTIEAQSPSLLLRTADADSVSAAAGVAVQVAGRSYHVLERQDGAAGVTILVLA